MDISEKRLKHLLGKAMEWIGENESGQDLYETFADVMGMNDDEIEAMGFTSLREQEMTADEQAFAALIRQIGGTDMGNIDAWLESVRSLAEADAEALGSSPDECYRKLLGDFGSAFQEMEQRYEGSAAAIFNYKPGYTFSELLPAADWIHNGGTATEAYEMAERGAFELGTFVEREPKVLTQEELDAIYQRHYSYLNNLPGGECADLSHTVLIGLEMHGMDFSEANFCGAVLKECDMGNSQFNGCDFCEASFQSVQAGGTSFVMANFSAARFEQCNFFSADFEDGVFIDAVFENTNMHGATLDGGEFTGAEFIGTSLANATTVLAKGLAIKQPVSEAQAELEVIHAKHTLWQYGDPAGEQADFTGIAMTKMDFECKNFDGALFRNAELSRCEMSCCSLIGADFSGAFMDGCDLNNAACQNANFAGAELHDCDFTGAELDGADFSQAFIHHCNNLEEDWPSPAMTMEGGM